MEEVVIVGAGIAGLATAVALKRVGIKSITVLERAAELRATGAALSLFPNAWLALDALGVSDKLTAIYAPTDKGLVTDVKTKATQSVSYAVNKSSPRVVHRKVLLETLAEELPPNTIRFSSKLSTIETLDDEEEGSSICVLGLEDGTIIKAKVVIGCDGVHSVIARKLGLRSPVDSGRFAVRGLAVFPNGHGLGTEVQQFVDVSKRGGFSPLNQREAYWGFSCKTPPKDVDLRDPEQIKKAVIEDLAKDFPPSFLNVVQHSDTSTVSWAPLMFRYPWHIIFGNLNTENVTLAGDAMHPMTPDLGQGGCLALEDAVVLGRFIAGSVKRNGTLEPKEVGRAIKGYVADRRWRGAGVVTASFVAGWVQQDGSSWWMKVLRDGLFYKYVLTWIYGVMHYDCGKLPAKIE